MATSQTLTGLIPTIYVAAGEVSREQVGLTTAVSLNSDAARAAKDQTVRVPLGVAGAAEDITPGQQPANSGGATQQYADITITKARAVPILWSGEEQRSVSSDGVIYNKLLADQFADAIRKLTNEVEVDIANAIKTNASRAYGTAGTAPFGTAADLSDFAGVMKILEDNGAPKSDLQMALNSAAMANLRGKQSVLFKVNEAGSADMLRNGMTDRVQGFALRNTAGFTLHTKGSGAATYRVTAAGAALAATSIPVDTGSGTILAGDIVTFAGDTTDGTGADTTNKYVVNTALSGGSFSIGKPGLLTAQVEDGVVTVGNSYTPNAAFARSAVVLAARAPALPSFNGVARDMADDRMMITDPMTGLQFEVSLYFQYRQVKIEVALAWGVGVPRPEHVSLLLG